MTDRGLCTTCIRAGSCTLSSSGPVWHCEEFEPGLAPPVQPVSEPTAPMREQRYLGLCSNCAHRDHCTFERLEGGVWHCEEYE